MSSNGLVDIEDLKFAPEDTRRLPKTLVQPKRFRSSGKVSAENDAREGNNDGVIPGTQTVYVKTWGCSHNNR